MNKFSLLIATSAVLGMSACASSHTNVVRMSNVWSTTCNANGQNVVISAPTLAEFHAAIEQAPECTHGYTANAPSTNASSN